MSKGIVDLLLVVVNSSLRSVQMLDVHQHVEWIIQSHQEVIQLVQSLLVMRDSLEEHGEEGSVPVQESASSGFSHIPFPVSNDVNPPEIDIQLVSVSL